jgi:hypothetical protein|nr:MAG TPA: hypothetical protein [Caudoviricetes sp.]
MSIVNGIIQAPVSIADVKTVLGETSNDLATLCRSDKINMWAKFKPIELNKPFTSDEFDFENRKWRDNATWFKGANFEEDGICGMKVAHSSSLQSLTDLYDKGKADWEHVKVGTTFACPYRLSDFIGYKHAATAPFKAPTITSKTHESGSVVAVMMMKNAGLEYELTMKDLGVLSEAYFGLALKNNAGQIAYFKTSETPLKDGGSLVEIGNGNLAVGNYKAYIFLCSSALAFNTPPVQAKYFSIIDFQPTAVSIIYNEQQIKEYFTITAREAIKGSIVVEVKIKDSYKRTSNNKDLDIILRFTSSKLGSQMQAGEQAYTFANLEAGKEYTHIFDDLKEGQHYKIEYTFMGITQEIYVLQIN